MDTDSGDAADWASGDDSGADPAEKAEAVAAAEKARQRLEVQKARQATQAATGARSVLYRVPEQCKHSGHIGAAHVAWPTCVARAPVANADKLARCRGVACGRRNTARRSRCCTGLERQAPCCAPGGGRAVCCARKSCKEGQGVLSA